MPDGVPRIREGHEGVDPDALLLEAPEEVLDHPRFAPASC
jgi:hypothetical protein